MPGSLERQPKDIKQHHWISTGVEVSAGRGIEFLRPGMGILFVPSSEVSSEIDAGRPLERFDSDTSFSFQDGSMVRSRADGFLPKDSSWELARRITVYVENVGYGYAASLPHLADSVGRHFGTSIADALQSLGETLSDYRDRLEKSDSKEELRAGKEGVMLARVETILKPRALKPNEAPRN